MLYSWIWIDLYTGRHHRDLVVLLDWSITEGCLACRSARCAHEPLLPLPPPRYPRHAFQTRPACSHHNNINNTEASKSDDAFGTANQFQPAYAKRDRLAPVAPLSLSLTAGEGEGRSKARHISCCSPLSCTHAMHGHTPQTHTHPTHSHHLFPICSLWEQARVGWPGLVRRIRQLGR
jgi:hypothetical protein